MDSGEIVKHLKQGNQAFITNQYDKALEEFDPKDFDEDMRFFTGPRSRFHAYMFMVDHMTHHRGYSIVYLRVKGIKPPDFTSW